MGSGGRRTLLEGTEQLSQVCGGWKGPDERGSPTVLTGHTKGVSCGGSPRNKIWQPESGSGAVKWMAREEEKLLRVQ